MNKAEQRIAARWIPKGYRAVKIKGVDAVVYVGEQNGRWYGIAYAGTAANPAWNYWFRNQERLAEQIKRWGEGLIERAKANAERKAKRAAFQPTLKVGDVLKCVWGYEQTNVNYYEITRVMGKYVEAREIAQEVKETGWLRGVCAPAVGNYIGEAKRYRVKEGNRIGVYSFADAYPLEFKEVAGARIYNADNWTAYA